MLKNRTLISPRNSAVRPTSDKVRAAVFSSLGDIEGYSFLDLFAGTGAVGIEAYSRGAAHVTFIEKNAGILRDNARLLPKGTYAVYEKDLFKCSPEKSFDIIFIDPPYGLYPPEKILNWVSKHNLLASNGIIVYEESSKESFNPGEGFSIIKERTYGDTRIFYLNRKLPMP